MDSRISIVLQVCTRGSFLYKMIYDTQRRNLLHRYESALEKGLEDVISRGQETESEQNLKRGLRENPHPHGLPEKPGHFWFVEEKAGFLLKGRKKINATIKLYS